MDDPQFDYPINFGNAYSYSGDAPVRLRDIGGLFSLGEAVAVSAYVANLAMDAFTAYTGIKAVYNIVIGGQWNDWGAWMNLNNNNRRWTHCG